MLGDRVRKGERRRKINDLRSECIAAFTHCWRRAKYLSSPPSFCSIVLQGKGLSRNAGRPKEPYLFNKKRTMGFIKCINSLSMHSCLSPFLFICRGPRQESQVQSTYHIWAHMGLWHMLARVRAAWTEMTHVDSRLQSIPRAPVSGLSRTGAQQYQVFFLPPTHHPRGILSAHITPGRAFSSPSATTGTAPLHLFSPDLISRLWVSYGNVFPQRLCLSTAKYTWHSQQGRSMEQWAQRKQ